MVRISGFHPDGPGSIPGIGALVFGHLYHITVVVIHAIKGKKVEFQMRRLFSLDLSDFHLTKKIIHPLNDIDL